MLLATAHVAGPHDLILAEVIGAWADERVFSDGRWHFENAPDGLRSLHHVAGGFFYAVGAPCANHTEQPRHAMSNAGTGDIKAGPRPGCMASAHATHGIL